MPPKGRPPKGKPPAGRRPSGGEDLAVEEGPKKIPISQKDVDELARWIHESGRESGYENMVPWNDINKEHLEAYRFVARKLLTRPPRFLRRAT